MSNLTESSNRWSKGYGVITHQLQTQQRVKKIISDLTQDDQQKALIYSLFAAADRLANAAMWLVVHQTYAQNIHLDGSPLSANDFKQNPQGHTGGSLNMVPAYIGFMLANAISGITRGWVMEQGHCVAAIDSVNLLLNNMLPEHVKRYAITEEGLNRYVSDFYSYRLNEHGRQDSPLGSHVNIHTAGGFLEGGYLGFAGLQYIHMSLPGERLVAFLSDGAFEEQRGSDWAAHWWRGEDSGIVVPIMIFNGRRIDQRSLEAQGSGLASFIQHLKNYHFDPIIFDGTDPAAFACMILNGEQLLQERHQQILDNKNQYPVTLPYGVAVAAKGAGFFGAGTNAAHSLPLGANPRNDETARQHFNDGAKKLFVPLSELMNAQQCLQNHAQNNRLLERDYVIANRHVSINHHPQLPYADLDLNRQATDCPMSAIDKTFLDYVENNPELRPRIGNPDEILSNHMSNSLKRLKHRVTEVEPGVFEAVDGKVISALNEEAVVCACLGNKGGINLVVTYEAFSPKMLGALRQEIIWSEHLHEFNKPPQWLSIPVVLTSHTYENGKNERSHQDTTLCEAMLGEPSDVSRVLFPADYNSTVAALDECYRTQGKIFTLIVSKESIAHQFTKTDAQQLLEKGIINVNQHAQSNAPQIILTAIGSYQLQQVLIAANRLYEKGISACVNYMIEPGRFREARNPREARVQASNALRNEYYPSHLQARVFVTHTRPEIIAGILRPLNSGEATHFLGFINQGGTLNTAGMLFVNRQTWAHIIEASAKSLAINLDQLLTRQEIEALSGQRNPQGIII